MTGDIRYHVVSMVAVLVSLGVGILIGTTLVSDDALFLKQQEVIDKLDEDFRRLSEEKRGLEAQLGRSLTDLKQAADFEASVFLPLIKGRLAGKGIIILHGGRTPDGDMDELLELLRLSGASVKTKAYVSPDVMDLDRELLAQLFGGGNLPDGRGSGGLVLEELAEALFGTGDEGFLSVLDAMGLLKIEELSVAEEGSGGSEESGESKESAVILLAEGVDGRGYRGFFEDLVTAWRKRTGNLVGIPAQSDGMAGIELLKGMKIPTVDNINTIPGKVTLIHLLLGNKGHYGYGPAADRFMPATLFGIAP